MHESMKSLGGREHTLFPRLRSRNTMPILMQLTLLSVGSLLAKYAVDKLMKKINPDDFEILVYLKPKK